MDPQARRAIWELVEGIRDRGKTVFLTTHLMEEAERLCDRFGLLHMGQLRYEGTLDELRAATGCATLVDIFYQLTETIAGISRSLISTTRTWPSTTENSWSTEK